MASCPERTPVASEKLNPILDVLEAPGGSWARAETSPAADVHSPSGLVFPDDPSLPVCVVDPSTGAFLGHLWSSATARHLADAAWASTGADEVRVPSLPGSDGNVLVVRREGPPGAFPETDAAAAVERFLFAGIAPDGKSFSCDLCANAGAVPSSGAASCPCLSSACWVEMRRLGARAWIERLAARRKSL